MSEETHGLAEESDCGDLTGDDYTALADELFQQLDREEAAAGKPYEGWVDSDMVTPDPRP